jgi:hypothetical protein
MHAAGLAQRTEHLAAPARIAGQIEFWLGLAQQMLRRRASPSSAIVCRAAAQPLLLAIGHAQHCRRTAEDD